MPKCSIENEAGEVLDLTGNENIYQLFNVDGTNPPLANVNLAVAAGKDGATFNSSKLNTRNVVLYIKINGNREENRQRLNNAARVKEWCRVRYSNNTRSVYIDGIVESVNYTPFTMRQVAQVSILCPDPYWKGVDEILGDSSNTVPRFTFPFTIEENEPVIISELMDDEGIIVNNTSDAETGALITIRFNENAASVELRNETTGDAIKLTYTFLAGDIVEISTVTGNKTIKLIRGGVVSNLMSAYNRGGTFPQLAPGVNRFGYLVDDEAPEGQIEIVFRYHNVYRGL